ncbi:protein LYRIC isoform X2 [Colossoma macropomum]|uniref:protein LYRIC isoform X2 n=1 Tax=Colossoma macropomum TaxID=42526 RepID=UPI0018649333|nr:protein LYRIC isoform X2 [Colossoma macropomum]
MAQSWADRAEQMVFSLAEMLGLEAAAPLALWPVGVLLLSVGLGLILSLLLLGLHRPGAAREQRGTAEDIVLEPGKAGKPEEPKKRSRKKAGDKKLHRNGLAVEPQEEVKPAEVQSQDPADPKADKAKKNKKKPKAPAKEAKSAPSERKEPEEAGAWETKVSNREKRQQRRKDKGAGDESGSPGGVEPSAAEQPIITPEEPKITTPATPTKTKNTTTTTRTTTTTKNTTRTSTTSAPAAAAQRREEPPAAEVHAVIPQVSPGWEEVLSMNGSSWGELAAPVHPDSWNSLSAESQDLQAAWPQDMEGSWTIVDGSFTGLPAAGEPQPVPDLSWACQPQVDDEWSAPNTSCADPSSDWRPPSEEWGNYEGRPAEGAVSSRAPPAELQESDTEKDKEEPAAPGSGKAKKKKKKKKKLEDGGTAAQVEGEVGVAKDQNTAGNILPKTVKEQESVAPSAPPRATLKPTEPEMTPRSSATPTQKKPEDSWESPKQVKKKKARRET